MGQVGCVGEPLQPPTADPETIKEWQETRLERWADGDFKNPHSISQNDYIWKSCKWKIPALRRLRKDFHEFEVHTVKWDPVLKEKEKKKEQQS